MSGRGESASEAHPIRLHSASASSILCVVMITHRPSLCSRLMMSHSCRRVSGSSPVVGSSKNTISGFPIRAIAIERRRRIPPLKADASFPYGSPSSPTFIATERAAMCAALLSIPFTRE